MKKITLFTILVLFTSLCFTQDVYKYGYQKPFLGMKGKVKTVTEETFELKLRNDSIIQQPQSVVVFEFSKNGNLKSKSTSYRNYKNTITYSQYEDGRAKRFDREINTQDDSLSYTYKDSIRLFYVDNYSERLVAWKNYNQKNARTDTTNIFYFGDLTTLDPSSNSRKLNISETRDKRGNLIKEMRALRGNPGSWREWVYDENDLIISENGTMYSGFSLTDDYSFFYDYSDFDKKGNWLKKKINVKENINDDNSNMITKSIIKRKIKYY